MSMAALLQATRDKLRQDLPVPDGQPPKMYVGIMPGGGLPPKRGQWFVALDEVRVGSSELISLKEEYQIEVRVWKEATRFAADNQEAVYLEAGYGLDALERRVIISVHNSHELRKMACEFAQAAGLGTGDIFQKPLWYRGRGRTELSDVSYERKLIFSGATRIQAPDVMN